VSKTGKTDEIPEGLTALDAREIEALRLRIIPAVKPVLFGIQPDKAGTALMAACVTYTQLTSTYTLAEFLDLARAVWDAYKEPPA
jgi:hypothetical protein